MNLIINFGGNQLDGIVEGFGTSYLGTYHPDVRFRAQFIARRANVENSAAEGKVFPNFAK